MKTTMNAITVVQCIPSCAKLYRRLKWPVAPGWIGSRVSLHREGAYTFTESGTTDRRTFPGLDENEQKNHKGDLIYPNFFLSLAADHVAVFILQAQGPAATRIDCHFLFEPFEMEKPGFDPSDAVDFWHLVNRQDWSICERVQLGMASRVHHRGVFSPMEDWNLDIRRYVSDRIAKHVS